ncbi:MAG: DUF5670 family protein [Planctomycetota bacterium]
MKIYSAVLWTTIAVLPVVWVVGFITEDNSEGLIYLLPVLVVAVIAIEMVRYLRRQKLE